MLTYKPMLSKSNQNQKRIYIAPCIPQIQSRLADRLSEVGAMIQIVFKCFLKVSTVLVSTTSTGRLFHSLANYDM